MDLQPASFDIYDKKYRLKDKDENIIDKDIEATFLRVAAALASNEKSKDTWQEAFLYALRSGATPAGRIISNAGASKYKPATSLINCTVSSTIEDSMPGILEGVKQAGITLAAGCGIGYEFSVLRPGGAHVGGVGATTSGSLSFMDIYDKMCFTVSSAGGRRGAQMGTFDISHPDAINFIKAKREDGRFRQFNLSLLITKEFMDAVKDNKDWNFVFPVHKKEYDENDAYVWKEPNWPVVEGDVIRDEKTNLVAHRIFDTMKAKDVWDIIMQSTYDFAEPGFILIDEVNKMNNNWFCENIRATNPCGEQPLPEDGSCLLGSVNLTRFIKDAFTSRASFDWKAFEEIVAIFTRMLDNVVEFNGLPLKSQRHEITHKRRHGMGYLGLGSAMNMMGMAYGDAASVRFTEKVSKIIAMTGYKIGHELAIEKGAAPIMEEDFVLDHKMLEEYQTRGGDKKVKIGDKLKGKELFVFSYYMLKIRKANPELWDNIRKDGCRFTHHSSIAPTGTIALSINNNCSNGIEPSFAHHYTRNIIKPGKKTKENVDVWSYEALLYRHTFGESVELPDTWGETDNISPRQHIAVQAASQKWIDSSISKTVNIPTDFNYDEFKDIYMDAYDQNLKGCTTFRFNPENFQGVLVKKEDLANTGYTFVMDDGEEHTFQGDDIIEYEGEETTAANLYDAIKEGYYGKL